MNTNTYSAERRAIDEPQPACCDSVLLDRCCPPADKPSCCGTTASVPTACGCQGSPAPSVSNEA
jgi:hypothetical protein